VKNYSFVEENQILIMRCGTLCSSNVSLGKRILAKLMSASNLLDINRRGDRKLTQGWDLREEKSSPIPTPTLKLHKRDVALAGGGEKVRQLLFSEKQRTAVKRKINSSEEVDTAQLVIGRDRRSRRRCSAEGCTNVSLKQECV